MNPGNGLLIYTSDFNTVEFLAGWVFDSRNRALFADRGARHQNVAGGAENRLHACQYQQISFCGL